MVGKGGGPPDGHERQCQAKSRHTGKRCKRWALIGARTCQFHGGRTAQNRVVPTDHLPMFYAKVLNKTITEIVEQQLESDPAEQVGVFEELALVRVHAQQAVALYNAATEGDEVKSETVMAAGSLMVDVLQTVADFAKTASTISSQQAGKFSIHNLRHVINQIVRIAYDVFGEKYDVLAKEFERQVRERIRMPNEVDGTHLTPDLDVTEMDDMIPAAE